MKTHPHNGRPPAKRDRVVRHLRQRIVSGDLVPGARLPTHAELESRFDAESPTIRAAMTVLADEGFIETRPRRGTFVSRQPPHLTQVGFVHYTPVEDAYRYHFLQAIECEVDRWKGPARRILSFYNVGMHAETTDNQRLLHLIETDQLGGLVFTFNPYFLRAMASPVIFRPGLPRVVIESGADEGSFPAIYPDLAAFLPKAFAHLAALGCQRVAVIRLTTANLAASLEQIPALAAEHGLAVPSQWIQAVSTITGPWGRQLARLLVQGAPGERPDALVITDDNLVPSVTEGVRDSGVRVSAPGEAFRPGDLAVVAHANFPYPTPSVVPALRLGYDIPKLVATCMERLDQQRAGLRTEPMTWLPPLFEAEYAAQERAGTEPFRLRESGIEKKGERRRRVALRRVEQSSTQGGTR